MRRTWLVAAVVLAAALAGCVDNEAVDTLYRDTETLGDVLLTRQVGLGPGAEPTQAGETVERTATFDVRDGFAYLGVRVQADVVPDGTLTVRITDPDGTVRYDRSWTDHTGPLRDLARLETASGTWNVTYRFRDVLDGRIDVLGADPVTDERTDRFTEDRDHHFNRLVLSADGWEGSVTVRVRDANGTVAVERTETATDGAVRQTFESAPGRWTVEVAYDGWNGFLTVAVEGVFQGRG